jgi:cysteine-rich repeat protein
MKNKLIILLLVLMLSTSMVMAGTVTRSFSSNPGIQGGTVGVSLVVNLGDATFYSIEEVYPAGWTVSSVANNQICSDTNGKIQCVAFIGATSTALKYTLSIPVKATSGAFSGVYMFEGDEIETNILGPTSLLVAEAPTCNPDSYGAWGTCSSSSCTPTECHSCMGTQIHTNDCGDTEDRECLIARTGCPSGQSCNTEGVCEEPAPEIVCGNGEKEGTEECDDGNLAGGDGCSATCEIEPETPPTCTDKDEDGYCLEEGDCDDTSPFVYPGAEEKCGNGVDEDCSGADEVCTQTDPLAPLKAEIEKILDSDASVLAKITDLAKSLKKYLSLL